MPSDSFPVYAFHLNNSAVPQLKSFCCGLREESLISSAWILFILVEFEGRQLAHRKQGQRAAVEHGALQAGVGEDAQLSPTASAA